MRPETLGILRFCFFIRNENCGFHKVSSSDWDRHQHEWAITIMLCAQSVAGTLLRQRACRSRPIDTLHSPRLGLSYQFQPTVDLEYVDHGQVGHANKNKRRERIAT